MQQTFCKGEKMDEKYKEFVVLDLHMEIELGDEGDVLKNIADAVCRSIETCLVTNVKLDVEHYKDELL